MDFAALPQRIRDKISFVACPNPNLTGPCWVWTAQKNRGYGHVWWEGKTRISHRVIYLLSGRSIPEGFTLDHICEVKACQNWDHIKPATSRENTLRNPVALTAVNLRKTHCPLGHPLSGANLRLHDGRRHCITCRRKQDMDYYWKRAKLRRQGRMHAKKLKRNFNSSSNDRSVRLS